MNDEPVIVWLCWLIILTFLACLMFAAFINETTRCQPEVTKNNVCEVEQ